MKNFEFFGTEAALRYAHNAFKQLVTGEIQNGNTSIANTEHIAVYQTSPFAFGLKSADTALQKDLASGTLVQVKTNLTGEGEIIHYGVVVGPAGMRDEHDKYARYDRIRIRFSDGGSYDFIVRKHVFPSTYDPAKMERDDIKLADIPQDLMKLTACVNLDKCPLKKEGACLEN